MEYEKKRKTLGQKLLQLKNLAVKIFEQETDCNIAKLTSSKIASRHILKSLKNEKTSRGYCFFNFFIQNEKKHSQSSLSN